MENPYDDDDYYTDHGGVFDHLFIVDYDSD